MFQRSILSRPKQLFSRWRVWSSGFLALTLLVLGFGQQAEARKKYTKAQLPAIINKAMADAVTRALAKNKTLQKLRKQNKALKRRLKKGVCKSHNKKTTYCLRPVVKKAVFFSGKKRVAAKRVPAKVRRALQKSFNSLEASIKRKRKANRAQRKKVRKQATKERRKRFQKALKKFRKKAQSKVKAYLKSRKGKITKKLVLLMKKKLKAAFAMTKPKVKAKLLRVLKTSRSAKQIKRLMMVEKSASQVAKGFAKAALFAVARIIAFQSLKVAYACWTYQKEQKRACLKRELSKAYRDVVFKVTAKLIMLALDVSLIEPMSHSAASSVSAALAAATAGIGAASYPVTYVICSVSTNLFIHTLLSQIVRPQYNKLYRLIAPSVEKFNAAMLRNIPAKYLVCRGGNKICGRKCPYTAFEYKKACWRCPNGYERTKKSKKASPTRCQKRVFKPAKFHKKGKRRACRAIKAIHVLRKGKGECWSCPRGFKRTVRKINSPKACKGTSSKKARKIGVPK